MTCDRLVSSNQVSHVQWYTHTYLSISIGSQNNRPLKPVGFFSRELNSMWLPGISTHQDNARIERCLYYLYQCSSWLTASALRFDFIRIWFIRTQTTAPLLAHTSEFFGILVSPPIGLPLLIFTFSSLVHSRACLFTQDYSSQYFSAAFTQFLITAVYCCRRNRSCVSFMSNMQRFLDSEKISEVVKGFRSKMRSFYRSVVNLVTYRRK